MARLTTEYGTRARDAAARYNQERQQIQDNTDLTADAVKRQLDDLAKAFGASQMKLRSDERVALVARRAVLEKQLYGLNSTDPAAVIGFRDASDRVAQLKTGDACAELIDRATGLGDEQLAAAGARRAEQMDWTGAFRLWMSTRPWTEPIVDELADIDVMLSTRSSLTRAFTDFGGGNVT